MTLKLESMLDYNLQFVCSRNENLLRKTIRHRLCSYLYENMTQWRM